MGFMVVATLLGSAFALLYVSMRVRGAGVRPLSAKVAASVCFLVITGAALAITKDDGAYGYFILAGQATGVFGDVFLDMKYIRRPQSQLYTRLGFCAFGFGHLLFLAGVIANGGASLLTVAVAAGGALLFAGATVATEKPLGLHFGAHFWDTTLYAVLLSFLACFVIMGFLSGGAHQPRLLLMTLGLFSFLLSDAILSLLYFKKGSDHAGHYAANILLYYTAQYLISWSVLG